MQVYDLAQGSCCGSPGCTTTSLGFSDLPLPTDAPDDAGVEEGPGGEDRGSLGRPSMVQRDVVAPSGGDAGPGTSGSSSLQGDPGSGPRSRSGPFPRPSGSPAPEGRSSEHLQSLDSEDLDFLAAHLAPGTSKGYSYAFQKFQLFCAERQTSAYTCPPATVVKYIRRLFNDGDSYMTINLKKCAISKYHEGFDGLPIGSNILVKKAMKACFRLRPPLPRYTHTFDIVPLLDFISSWPPNNSLTLKQLTFKAVFLTIYSTISRVSSLARLGPTVTEHDDHIVLTLFCVLP